MVSSYVHCQMTFIGYQATTDLPLFQQCTKAPLHFFGLAYGFLWQLYFDWWSCGIFWIVIADWKCTESFVKLFFFIEAISNWAWPSPSNHTWLDKLEHSMNTEKTSDRKTSNSLSQEISNASTLCIFSCTVACNHLGCSCLKTALPICQLVWSRVQH